jgi:hypothetical protein
MCLAYTLPTFILFCICYTNKQTRIHPEVSVQSLQLKWSWKLLWLKFFKNEIFKVAGSEHRGASGRTCVLFLNLPEAGYVIFISPFLPLNWNKEKAFLSNVVSQMVQRFNESLDSVHVSVGPEFSVPQPCSPQIPPPPWHKTNQK